MRERRYLPHSACTWPLLLMSTILLLFLGKSPSAMCHAEASEIQSAFVSKRKYRFSARNVDSNCAKSEVFSYPLLLSEASRCTLHATRPQDNLASGVSEIALAFSLGVLWSEYSIALTGCGPPNFSDILERICYQGVIVSAGLALFNRIVTGGGLDRTVAQWLGPLDDWTVWQVRAAEWTSALAVLGAFVALGFQYTRGVTMDGLSGIDIGMCRALRDI